MKHRSLSSDFLLPGIFSILLAWLLGLVIYRVGMIFDGRPESAVFLVGGMFGLVAILPLGFYLLKGGRFGDPGKIGLLLVSMLPALLLSIYLFQVSFQVKFPGDFLIWSESDFVNDILKFRVGYPIYSDQHNNDSFVYPVGPQLSTYFLASLAGKPTSIPVYRLIQVGYTFLAALAALLCCLELIRLIRPAGLKDQSLFGLLLLPLLFLIASNPLTNPFVHNLHDDALAQLVSTLAFFMLLRYMRKKESWVFWLMALIPAAGLMVKQSLVIWSAFYFLSLALLDQPRSWKLLISFFGITVSAVVLVVGASYAAWGEHYFYWVYEVLGSHGVSPLRSFRNLLQVWPALSLGLVAGLVLLRGEKFRSLIAPWLVWLAFISVEIYTSGIAWMVNHIGPGTLIAGVWFGAALIELRESQIESQASRPPVENWLNTGITIALAALLLSGLGIFRVPVRPDMDEMYRYLAQIEQQFAGLSSEQVLLDAGSWVYLKDGVVMKDRAPSIGERGYSQSGDFSAFLERLENRQYARIMVRNFHSPNFWYDHYLWSKSSGIRQSLNDNYIEIGQIEAVPDTDSYLFAEISILAPRQASN